MTYQRVGKPITLKQAKELKPGQVIYSREYNNSDGTPQRWRVNGKVRTWKTMVDRVYVPLKHGIYDYDAMTETDLDSYSLEGEE